MSCFEKNKKQNFFAASIEEVQEPWVDLDFGIVDELPDTDILESTDDIPINDLVSALTARIKSYKNAKKDFDYLGLLKMLL